MLQNGSFANNKRLGRMDAVKVEVREWEKWA